VSAPKEIAVTGIDPHPTADGDHLIELTMPDGSVTTGFISPAIAHVLVSVLNPVVHANAVRNAKTMVLPSATLAGLSIVHPGPAAELLLDITEMGSLVLLMSDEWLDEVQKYVNRVQASRKISKTVQ
jgi:hypothetical protein